MLSSKEYISRIFFLVCVLDVPSSVPSSVTGTRTWQSLPYPSTEKVSYSGSKLVLGYIYRAIITMTKGRMLKIEAAKVDVIEEGRGGTVALTNKTLVSAWQPVGSVISVLSFCRPWSLKRMAVTCCTCIIQDNELQKGGSYMKRFSFLDFSLPLQQTLGISLIDWIVCV